MSLVIKDLGEIVNRLRSLDFSSRYDLVIGIANGGIVPAYLVHSFLDIPLDFIWIKFRDSHHQPIGDHPQLIQLPTTSVVDKKILLVDDRSKTGATFSHAKQLLASASLIHTLVVNGRADYSLFDQDCFAMPWNLPPAIPTLS